MTTKYKLQFNKRYLKDLIKIPTKFQKHIKEAVVQLAENPRPDGFKKLHDSGSDVLYRIRCGDYRIVYTVKDSILLVIIIEVGHRREIYR